MEKEKTLSRIKLTAKVHYKNHKFDHMWTARPITVQEGLSANDKFRALRHAQRQLAESVELERTNATVLFVEINFANPTTIDYSEDCEYKNSDEDSIIPQDNSVLLTENEQIALMDD